MTKLQTINLLILILIGMSSQAIAATIEWDGGANTTNWNDAANWDGNDVPDSNDKVVFKNGLTLVFSNVSPATMPKEIKIEGGANITFPFNLDLEKIEVKGAVSSTAVFNGTVSLSKELKLKSLSVVTFNAAADIKKIKSEKGGGTLNFNANASVETLELKDNQSTTINTAATASLTIAKDVKVKGSLLLNGGTVVFDKKLEVEPNASFTSSANLRVHEDVEIKGSLLSSGAITFDKKLKIEPNGSFTSSANLTVSEDVEIKGSLVNSGTIAFDKKLKIEPSGSFTNSATVTVDEDAEIKGSLINSGIMTFEEDLDVKSSGTLTNSGTIIVNGTYDCEGSCDALSVLPVELTYFTAQLDDATVMLEWQTATELNNEGFEIQRGQIDEQSGELKWQYLTYVSGYGNSSELQDYSYIDEHPAVGVNYYRLKQNDYDDQFEYSKIVSVRLQGEAISNTEDQAPLYYPNPVRGALTLEYISFVTTDALLDIYDLNGKKVSARNLALESGLNRFSIDVSNLAKGSYVAVLWINKQKQTQLLVVE